MTTGKSGVLITGASSGIGEAFARRYASLGRDLIVVARRTERLEQLAEELRAAHQISVLTITADLSTNEGCTTVSEVVSSAQWEVEGLVNNAGFGVLGKFEEIDPQRTLEMVDLNCRAVVALTQGFLPQMKARGKGEIIIVSSVVGALPAPWFSVYAATKSFDLYFGEALHGECEGTGVKVLTVLPGLTRTEFQASSGMRDYHSPYRTAEQVVTTALAALGKKSIVVDGMMNKLLIHGTRFLPRFAVAMISRFVMKVECKIT